MPHSITAKVNKNPKEGKSSNELQPGWHDGYFQGIVEYRTSERKGMFFGINGYVNDKGYTFAIPITLFPNDMYAVDRNIVNNILIASGFKAVEHPHSLPALPGSREPEATKLGGPLNIKIEKNDKGYWTIMEVEPLTEIKDDALLVPYDGTDQEDDNEPPF